MSLLESFSLLVVFFNGITQKLLNGLRQNLDGAWVSAQNRPRSFLVWIQIMERIQEFVHTLLKIAIIIFHSRHIYCRSLVSVIEDKLMWIFYLVILIYG